jgi:hypothetical protein
MAIKEFKRYCVLLVVLLTGYVSFGQSVPLGIFYQAVARDNMGKELINREIDVKLSIISGNPLGPVAYQELWNTTTTKFGVFTLRIGEGQPTGGTYGSLAEVQWGQSSHFLKVEVKLDNDFVDMGTMQFMSVPYALYAQKSLEPGPEGPKGDPGPQGDPASDNQVLSVTSGAGGNYLAISNGNSVLLSSAEGDGDPANEIQDLTINADKLKITKNALATEWDLTRYLDNTDNQALSYNAVTRRIGISGNAGTIDLTELKDDADANATNELQSLSFNKNTGDLTISSRNTVNLENSIGFKAKKSTSQSGLTAGSTYPFICSDVEFNDGSGYDAGTGSFTAPIAGIYTFYITYKADGSGSARVLSLLKNGIVYEILGPDISSGSELAKWVTVKLDQGNIVSMTINTGTSTYSGTGSFLGYKVN